MKINHTVIAAYSNADMYALVSDIAAYPEFLPWCTGAEITQDGDAVEARLDIRYKGFRTFFTTRNINTPDSHIRMALSAGPLSALRGEWHFIPIEPRRCRIEFNLHYEFSNKLMAMALEKIFASIFADFIDHFINRARVIYRSIDVEIVQAQGSGGGANARALQLPPGATVADALAAANLPYSDSVSVFGRLCGQGTPLASGDRIEINMPLPNPPRQARRQRQ